MIKIQVLFSIVLLGLFSPAHSQVVYWVDNDGAATWIEAQSSTPLSDVEATSMAEANVNAQAGDLIFMRGGNYVTTIEPTNSGTSGNPITYQRYLDEDVVFDGISKCVDLNNKHYIIVDGIGCYRTDKSWVSISNGGSYNTIKNSTFETAYNWAGIGLASGTHHTSIINNSFLATCTRTTPYPGDPEGVDTDAGGPADHILQNGTKYDLVEGNYFGQGGFHYAITGKTSYSIFRNNTFHNRWHGNLGLTDYAPVVRNIVEDNIFLESGRDRETNYCGQPRDRAMAPEIQNQLGGNYNKKTIVRGNIFIDGGNAGFSNMRSSVVDQRIYNNTFYKNVVNFKFDGEAGIFFFENEVFVNNILAKGEKIEISVTGPAQKGITLCYNNTWDAAGGRILFGILNNTCNNSNLNIDPLFVNEAEMPRESDLHLQAASPMIDAAAWLTTITSASGTGSSFQVADALYFYDGFDFVKGDVIQLEGQDTPIRIVRVDYVSNTLSVDRSISWTQGLGVSLPYSGSKPDIGAFEFIEESNGSQTPYEGIAWELPGVLEAENYDNGGKGIAFHDLSSGSNGGQYRTDDVDIYAAGDLGGGYIIGDMEAGEWLEYSINVFNGGSYALSTRIASAVSSGKYSISIDDVDVTGTVDVPYTGGDQVWQTLSTDNINLSTGLHILRVNVISGGFNLNSITVSDTEVPSVPTSLVVTDSTALSLSISWIASTDNIGVVEYDIYKKGLFLGTASTNEYTDSKLLAPGKTYSYTVLAKDIVGNVSAQSEAVEGTTLQYQKITITPISDKFTNEAPFDVEATVTTNLLLTYEVSGPATSSGKAITLDGNPGTVEVTVAQAGDATYGRTSKTTSFEVMLVTGLEDELPTLKIYPIPATDWLNIEGIYSDNTVVQVIDIMGKQVLFESLRNNRLSISNLPEGAYILNISDKGLTYKSKIIIQR